MIVYTQSQMILTSSLSLNSTITSSAFRNLRFKFEIRSFLKPLQLNSNEISQQKSSVLQNSLRVLEWDKVCDSVASFAGTSLGREATKVLSLSVHSSLKSPCWWLRFILQILIYTCVISQENLWSLNQTYEESMNLLAETNAAVEMLKYGGCGVDFTGINVALVSFILSVHLYCWFRF